MKTPLNLSSELNRIEISNRLIDRQNLCSLNEFWDRSKTGGQSLMKLMKYEDRSNAIDVHVTTLMKILNIYCRNSHADAVLCLLNESMGYKK